MSDYVQQQLIVGKKELQFISMKEFSQWKELEEESTYTTYVRQQQSNYPATSEGK